MYCIYYYIYISFFLCTYWWILLIIINIVEIDHIIGYEGSSNIYIYFTYQWLLLIIEIGDGGGYKGSSRCKSGGCGSTGTIFYRTVCSFAWTTLGTIFRSLDPLSETNLPFFFPFFFFLGLLRVRERFGRYSCLKETTGLRNTRQFLCRYTRTSEPLIVSICLLRMIHEFY